MTATMDDRITTWTSLFWVHRVARPDEVGSAVAAPVFVADPETTSRTMSSSPTVILTCLSCPLLLLPSLPHGQSFTMDPSDIFAFVYEPASGPKQWYRLPAPATRSVRPRPLLDPAPRLLLASPLFSP